MRRKNKLLISLLYLLFLTAALMVPANFVAPLYYKGLGLFFHFAGYGLLGWLLPSALGNCPLRWRRLTPWVLLIALAHAYWMEFLQGFWPTLGRNASYYDFTASATGAATGILLNLRYAYSRCNCELSAKLKHFPQQGTEDDMPTYTGMPENIALITHHPALPQIIACTFGWKAMTIQDGNNWKLKLICTGKSLVSLPHFSYGAVFAPERKPGVHQRIEEYIHKLHFDRGFAGLEFRRVATPHEAASPKTASWLALHRNPEKQWQGFSSNLRRKISKAKRNGFEVEQGGQELLADFYAVYARHMRKLGSGALKKRFFEQLLTHYTEAYAGIFLVKLAGKTVGGAFNLAYEGFYENGWFATLHAYQRQYPSYLLHKAMIDHAINLGCHTYSFGRSTHGSGVHLFKQQWGGYEVPLRWVHYPEPSVHLRSQAWIRKLWKHLPYPLGNRFGHWIAKWIY